MVRSLALSLIPCIICPAQSPDTLSPEDRQVLWQEACATHNGLSYQYELTHFHTAEEAREWLSKPPFLRPKRPRQSYDQRFNEIPWQLREAIGSMGLGPDPGMEPLRGPDTEWVLVVLNSRQPRAFGQDMDPDPWLAAYAASALPSPEALRNREDLVARSLLNRLGGAPDLAQALASGKVRPEHLDRLLSDGQTPLTKALLRGDLDLAAELLERGASADRCSLDACPLTAAVLQKNREAVRLLLAHHASPDGAGAGITPLMAALAGRDRALAQTLLDAGANPLATRVAKDQVRSVDSTLSYVPSEDTRLYAWFQQVADQALRRRHNAEWSAWIEQGGRRQRITDGAAITLARAPFQVVLQMQPFAVLRLVASEDAGLPARFREPGFRRGLLSPLHVGAGDFETHDLFVTGLAMEGALPGAGVVTQSLNFSEDLSLAGGLKRIVSQGREALGFEVRNLDFPGDPRRSSAVGQYQGPGLNVAMGVQPPGLGRGADLYQPMVFHLAFKSGPAPAVAPEPPAPQRLALINGELVTEADFQDHLEATLTATQLRILAGLPDLAGTHRRRFIETRIFMGEAMLRPLPAFSPEAYRSRQSPKDRAAYLQDMVKALLKADGSVVLARTTPTEPCLQSYFKAHAQDFAQKESWTARTIMVTTGAMSHPPGRTPEQALARMAEIQARLRAGRSFEDCAAEYSDDPGSRNRGGLWENVPFGRFVAEVDAAVRSQEIGKLGEPFKSHFGYHLIVVDRITPGSEATFAGARDKVLAAVKARLVDEAVHDYATRLAAYRHFRIYSADFQRTDHPAP
jgi:hypothetical protein